MGIIEDRRRKLAQREIEKAQINRNIAETNKKDRESFSESSRCFERSGLMPLLKLLVPPLSDRFVPGGYARGNKIDPPEEFIIGEYSDHKKGLKINVTLEPTIKDPNHYGIFNLEFHPDGKIIIDSGPKGSTTLSVADLSREPKLGEMALEKAYLNPYKITTDLPETFDDGSRG